MQLKKSLPVVLALALAAVAGSPVFAATWYTAESAVGHAVGFTQYRIDIYDPSGGGYVGSSLLKFPLDNSLLGVKFTGPAGAGWVLRSEAYTRVTLPAGALQDSDWLEDDGHDGLDIYSESRLDLTGALLVNVQAVAPPWQLGAWSLSPLAGLKYESWSFLASDVNQVGYGPYAADDTGSVPGPCLDYRVTYRLPYLGAEAASRRGRWDTEWSLAFSPLVTASDVDDHLLRSKRSVGTSSGTGWLASVTAGYRVNETTHVYGRLEWDTLATAGTQRQYIYNADGSVIDLGTVDLSLKSEQLFAGLSVRSVF